ncbi:MAG: hypothetical protein SGI83_03425 [Bacteroidota bacterium]|nr:hypothetical protein [Bacteroidota bacterium]
MKKIIVSFSFLLVAGISTAFAREDPGPDQKTLDLFKNEFKTAENVRWDKQGEYDKATFLLLGRRVIAWFNTANQLEGCVRDIFFDQLPLTVMKAVDKRFADADILAVSEISNTEGTSYRIILEVKNKKYNIKVGSAGNIDDVEKLAK